MHKLGDTFYLIFPAHAATGELHDADSTPVVEVFEDASDTAMAYLPTVAKVGTNTGYYRATIVATAGNGFEAGKCYNIMAKVVMGGLDRSARIDLIPSLQAKDVDDTNTAIGALNNVSVADVEQACEDGLADYGASTATEVKAVEDKVDDVYTDTQRVDGLIEDDGGGADRFTAKALEQAGGGGGGGTVIVDVDGITRSILDAPQASHMAPGTIGRSISDAAIERSTPVMKNPSYDQVVDVDLSGILKGKGQLDRRATVIVALDRYNKDVTATLIAGAVYLGQKARITLRGGEVAKAPYTVRIVVRTTTGFSCQREIQVFVLGGQGG